MRAMSVRRHDTVGRAHAHHEKARGIAMHAKAVALRVESPRAKPHVEIVRRDRVEALDRVAANVVQDGPGRFLAFDALDALCWCFSRFRHKKSPPERTPAGTGVHGARYA